MAKITRRKALASIATGIGAAGAAAAVGPGILGGRPRQAHAAADDRRFLITIGATGGASIIDSFLAVREGEVSAAGGDPNLINAFPDNQVIDVGPFRAVTMAGSGQSLLGTPLDNIDHSTFATKHQADMQVVTVQNTSVNHVLAQKRSINGNAAWGGRTLQEAVALAYGADCPVPNANMASFGFVEPGADTSLPGYAYPEPIANPRFWSLGLDSVKGIKNAPERDIIELATRVRDERLDPESAFYRTFEKSKKIQRWMAQRGATKDQIQTLDLITKLTVIPDRPPEFPLAEHGLEQTPDGQRILAAFPGIDIDPLHAQAALAYLLIKYDVAVSVTLSPSFNPVIVDLPQGGFLLLLPPLAFDNSHGAHRQTQAFMWFRVLDLIDKMSDLLKEDEFGTTGESLYDRSLFYVATDFGRTRGRTGGTASFGSGHDLDNGAVIVSPMSAPGLFGGVDPGTATTFGFSADGTPDPGRTTSERELYAGILQTLGIDTSEAGLPDMSVLVR